jgi:hypothetical protein
MKPGKSSLMGAKVCARYAFAPNFFHYCGPETEGEFGSYVAADEADSKLIEYLTGFETLYPYLESIAHANGIKDPFDPRVVEAYWVGNNLLNSINPKQTFEALTLGQRLHQRLDKKTTQWLYPKIDLQAKLHHSFHVFNIFTRTGHRTVAHTVETMDQCRIGWGQVVNSKGKTPSDPAGRQNLKHIQLNSQRLEYRDGRLRFVETIRPVINPIEQLELDVGDWVSYHWGYVCEKISPHQVKWLKQLTAHHLQLANQTL